MTNSAMTWSSLCSRCVKHAHEDGYVVCLYSETCTTRAYDESRMDAMTTPTGSPSERLRATAAAARVPESVIHAWNAAPPDPEPGQVWRARWNNDHQLVLLHRTIGSTVTAAPATLEPDLADDTAEVLSAEDTTLGMPLVLWQSLARSLPMRVLDRLAGQLVTAEPEAGQVQPPRPAAGQPVMSPIDPRVLYRARLEDTMAALADARWAPQGTGTLGGLLAEAGFGPEELCDALGVTPQQALAVLRGDAPISEDQAEALTVTTGLSVVALMNSNPELPPDLVNRLDRPACRARVGELARRRQVGELRTWQSVGFAIAALAARQTGPGRNVAWDDRIDQYFAVVLDD